MNDPIQQLAQYIHQHLLHGYDEETIRHTLLQHGWGHQHVDEAFRMVATNAQNPHQAASSTRHHAAHPSENQEQPEKYTLRQALQDALRAIRVNFVPIVLLTLLLGAISLVGSMIIVLGLNALLFDDLWVLLASPTEKLIRICFSILIYLIWVSLASSLTITTLAFAVSDGSKNIKSQVTNIMKRSLGRVLPVAGTEALFYIIVIGPLVLLQAIMLSQGLGGGFGGASTLSLVLLIPFAFIWMIVAMLRCALMSHVAIFEPHIPLLKTFKRSSHLLQKGGQWFLIKGFLAIVVPLLFLAGLFGGSPDTEGNAGSLIIGIYVALASFIASAVMVMLYLNRRAVRG